MVHHRCGQIPAMSSSYSLPVSSGESWGSVEYISSVAMLRQTILQEDKPSQLHVAQAEIGAWWMKVSLLCPPFPTSQHQQLCNSSIAVALLGFVWDLEARQLDSPTETICTLQ